MDETKGRLKDDETSFRRPFTLILNDYFNSKY